MSSSNVMNPPRVLGHSGNVDFRCSNLRQGLRIRVVHNTCNASVLLTINRNVLTPLPHLAKTPLSSAPSPYWPAKISPPHALHPECVPQHTLPPQVHA